LVVKFYEVIHVIEQIKKMGLTSLWLECDFAFVYGAFTAISNVP